MGVERRTPGRHAAGPLEAPTPSQSSLDRSGPAAAAAFGGVHPFRNPPGGLPFAARHGPFVVNTRSEIIQAVEDYKAGKMGHLQ